jgi:hypothetical protein
VRQHASLEGSLTLDFESFGLTGPSRLASLAPQDDGRDLARSSPIQLSNSHAPSPVFFGRPRAGPRREVQFFAPSRGAERRQTRGCARPPMDGRRDHPVGRFAKASPFSLVRRKAPPGAPQRRSATRTGRAFENVDQPRLSASSWRRVLLPGSGAPPSPGCFRVRFPEARGAASADGGISPLGRPGEIRPYLRPSPHRCSVFTASHDDAPRRAGLEDYRPANRTGQ